MNPWLARIVGTTIVTTAMAVAVAILKKMAEPDELDRPYINGDGILVDPTKPFWRKIGL
jgi:hypothetical protein